MDFVVSQQVAVTADSVKEALQKAEPNDGQVISASVNPRPQQPTQGQVTAGGRTSQAFSQTTTVPVNG